MVREVEEPAHETKVFVALVGESSQDTGIPDERLTTHLFKFSKNIIITE